MKTKEWLEVTDASGVPLYKAEEGHLCQDLLPPEVREGIEHTEAMVDTDENTAPVDPVAEVKLFTPDGPFTWYVVAFYGDDTLYGYVKNTRTPAFSEHGYFSLAELEGLRDVLGLPVERDVFFTPTPLSELR